MRIVFPRLYPILDESLLRQPCIVLARTFAEQGVKMIQFRNKQAASRELFENCRGLVTRLHEFRTRIIVNDRPDIAAMVGAGGVHVGQEDLTPEEAHRICGPNCWVGVSTHNADQLSQAIRSEADYVAIGPIFPTATKANADPVVGLELVRHARALTQKPIVAIGGITVETARDVYRAGADCIAVASDLLAAPDPVKKVCEYLAIAKREFGKAA